MATSPNASAVRTLSMEYKSLQEEPVEGFRVKLAQNDNLFDWEVAIFGPPDTLYQGAYFKVIIVRPNRTGPFSNSLFPITLEIPIGASKK